MTKKSSRRQAREAAERDARERAERLREALGRGSTAGRGQEEFTGDFGRAFESIRRERERRAQERARRTPPPPPGRGVMHPFVVGWRITGRGTGTIALGRTVMLATSLQSCQRRAERWCRREVHYDMDVGNFEVRYILEKVT